MARSDTDDRHWLRRLMDNTWLLLVLGCVLPTVSFTLWAWVELWLLPAAKLP